MKGKDLLELGFKEMPVASFYELRFKGHLFITNDSYYNDGTDDWHIGYFNENYNSDLFWFNKGLTSKEDFKIVFKMLTGIRWVDFKFKANSYS